uniref:uncharacterized protein LOC105349686 n=1 Tax=Fragaria vesca subsp. vesca TaxID=101020 RepID=UPI0005C8DD9B|nr:PREDICTED: uncharacterized protein LOC105349686 [Fragaria vesca subsp. vesca]
MSEKSLNPESYVKEEVEEEQSPRPHKRVKTGTCSLEYADDKSLFLCSMERYWDRPNFRPPPPRYPRQPWDSSYVVRSINLPDLLTSSSSEKLELRELARMDDKDFPGTKLFMSTRLVKPTADCPICCFDFAARDPEWRRVPSLCQGGPLPIAGQAVAVDMPQPEHGNKKLLFSARHCYSRCNIVVHLMSLDENQETISEIFEMNLPAELPHQPWPNDCHFFHLGGNNVFLVTTARVGERTNSGIYTGGAVLFQFEFDISKVDTDRKNCFTLQFQPPRIFEYHSSPDCMSPPDTLGCFLL